MTHTCPVGSCAKTPQARLEIKVSDDAVERRALVAQARVKLAALSPRESVEVELPTAPYSRREAYRKIAGAAHYLFGPGNYYVVVKGNKMLVTRGISRREAGRAAWNVKWGR